MPAGTVIRVLINASTSILCKCIKSIWHNLIKLKQQKKENENKNKNTEQNNVHHSDNNNDNFYLIERVLHLVR